MSVHPDGTVTAVSRDGTHSFSKPKQAEIILIAGLGVEGDAHAGVTARHRGRVAADPTQPNLRQVHLIHGELFDELRAAGYDVRPGQLGDNVTTSGIDLLGLPRGTVLRFGAPAAAQTDRAAAAGSAAPGAVVGSPGSCKPGSGGSAVAGSAVAGSVVAGSVVAGSVVGVPGVAGSAVVDGSVVGAPSAAGSAVDGPGAGGPAVGGPTADGPGETAGSGLAGDGPAVIGPAVIRPVEASVAAADELAEAIAAVVAAAERATLTEPTKRAVAAMVAAAARAGDTEGATVVVTGLRNPCAQINGFKPGLLKRVINHDEDGNLVRKGGVMAVVLRGGPIRPGDPVVVELPPAPHSPLEPV